MANNKRVHTAIGATNWSIKTSLISQTPSVRTGHLRLLLFLWYLIDKPSKYNTFVVFVGCISLGRIHGKAENKGN